MPHGTSRPTLSIYIEAVHRLSDLGAVVTHVVARDLAEGFDAEWRMICLSTVDGDLISRCEIFDEADLDAALARFDELDQPRPRLENAASQADERFQACFAARDWDAMAESMAEDIFDDDRRRVVGAGVRHGRDAEIANMRAVADVGITDITSTVIATRGERLALSRERFSGSDQRAEAFYTDVLGIVEINADDRIAVRVAFDPDDSTPLSRNSTPATSPAKRPPTRTHGRSSSRRPTPRSIGASSPRRRRTG